MDAGRSIRSFDFCNFSFPTEIGEASVVNGVGTIADRKSGAIEAAVTDVSVQYGRLGTGRDEQAVVVLSYRDRENNDLWREVFVYGRDARGVELLGSIIGGCCGCADIRKVSIRRKQIVIERPTWKCGPRGPGFEIQYWQWDGSDIVEADNAAKKR
jgi:hypothetical protein